MQGILPVGVDHLRNSTSARLKENSGMQGLGVACTPCTQLRMVTSAKHHMLAATF
jgi:hypothetical protein